MACREGTVSSVYMIATNNAPNICMYPHRAYGPRSSRGFAHIVRSKPVNIDGHHTSVPPHTQYTAKKMRRRDVVHRREKYTEVYTVYVESTPQAVAKVYTKKCTPNCVCSTYVACDTALSYDLMFRNIRDHHTYV